MKIKNIFQNKKGVSPLIATVLLIAFAVALGAVVMNWGRGYVEDTADSAKEKSDKELICSSEVDLAIVEIDGVSQICYNSTSDLVEFILENKRSRTVEDIAWRMIGTDTKLPGSGLLNFSLSSNQAVFGNFSLNYSTFGVPKQVVFTPKVRIGDELVDCTGNVESFKDLQACSKVWT